MTITELFTLIENQAENEAMNEPANTRFATKYAYFSTNMFSALVSANLTDEQIETIINKLKLNKP